VSSHLLSEIEQICDHVVMIRGGRLLFQGNTRDLLNVNDPHILLAPERSADARRLLAVLAEHGVRADIQLAGVPSVAATSCDQRTLVVAHAPERMAADLNRMAMHAGIVLRGLRTYRPSLEETFLRATGVTDGDLRAAATGEPDSEPAPSAASDSNEPYPTGSDTSTRRPALRRRAAAGRQRGGS
jgi:ABC-2 type transport system ATP-binding protein